MKGKYGEIVRSDRTFDVIAAVLGCIIIVIVMVPLIFVVAASFSDPDLVIRGEVLLWPKGLTTKAYTMVFENKDIWRGFRNTMFYTALGTIISVTLTVLAAYPLSRKNLRGRNFIMMAVLFTMYFSGGMVPTYLLVKDLGMYNTIWAILIPLSLIHI